MKFCILCNEWGNGSEGEPGTEAVAKYYLDPKDKGKDQINTGWVAICNECVSWVSVHREIVYLKGHSRSPEQEYKYTMDSGKYYHNLTKESLVTQIGNSEIFDWMKCVKCGYKIKRHGLGIGFNITPIGCNIK